MGEMSRQARKIWQVVGWAVLFLLAVGVVVAILNRAWLVDWLNGLRYAPEGEMAEIETDLALTDGGEFLFKATQPVLLGAEEFNQNCREDVSEVAVLGCYNDGKIYVYDITAAELDGIREVTTAHELLHAVWARMNKEQRAEISEMLSAVLAENEEILAEEIEAYDAVAQQEEIYVRAGTEVRELPAALEEHFAEVFADRGQVVGFYEDYIGVFREIAARAEQLEQEITSLKAKIAAGVATFEARATELESKVTEFNACAATAGCFSNQSEFLRQREELLGEQWELTEMSREISGQIDDYNARIDEYNQNATRSQKLQEMVNSMSAPEVGF